MTTVKHMMNISLTLNPISRCEIIITYTYHFIFSVKGGIIMKYSKTVTLGAYDMIKYLRWLELGTDINFEREGIEINSILLTIPVEFDSSDCAGIINICAGRICCFIDAFLFNINGMIEVDHIVPDDLLSIIRLNHFEGLIDDEYEIIIKPE